MTDLFSPLSYNYPGGVPIIVLNIDFSGSQYIIPLGK